MTNIDKTEQIKQSAEYILANRLGWTAFTNWAKIEFTCTHYKANQLWNRAWELINSEVESKIAYNAQAAFIELEQLKQIALENNDRRTHLECIKYQGKINNLEAPSTVVNVNGDNIKIHWGNADDK